MTAQRTDLIPLLSTPLATPALLGGKGFGLWRLARAGLPIPLTFCISPAHFEDALASAMTDAPDLAALTQALEKAPLSTALIDAIRAVMDQHPGASWALRSSALDEDGLTHSFAGQQHTQLHVTSPEQAAHAIRAIWAAAFSPRALLYRAESEAQQLPAPVAVLLQQMIQPAAAGVLFTQNPVSPASDELVINAASGLGVQVVDGQASHTYYLEKPSGYLRRHQAPAEDPEQPSPLTPQMLGALTRMAGRVEELFGQGQDLEWAWDKDGLTLLQLRPMTAREQAQPTRAVWSNVNVGEALPGVGTPLTWSIIRSFSRMGFVRAFGSLGLDVPEDFALVGSFQGRVYLNLTQFMSIASAIPLLAPDTLVALAGGGGASSVQQTITPRSPAQFLARLPVTIPRIALGQLATPLVAPLWERFFLRQRDAFFAEDLGALSSEALAARMHRLERLFERNGLITLTVSANFLMSFVAMRELLRLFAADQAAPLEQALLGDLRVRSAEPGLDLLRLGHVARRSLRLRRVLTQTPRGQAMDALNALGEHPDVENFLNDIRAFRANHGHRAPREAELATPRWREDSTFLFDVLRGYIEAPHLPSAADLSRERATAFKAARARLHDLIPAPLQPSAAALVAWSRFQARWREALRALVIDSLDMMRRFSLECGARMVTAGHLRSAQDVFFLHQDELRAWVLDPASSGADLAYKVMIRRAVYDLQSAMPDPPSTFVLQGTRITPDTPDLQAQGDELVTTGHKDVIRGLPGGAGRITGRARVMFSPQDAELLEPGELLVVPHADVGWTPLFLGAGAVVMGLGGPLSHACIVAREFGLPVVVNATHAAQRIKTGDRITVDGDQGLVIIHEYPV
jgi:rifampicin phosphotransferase